MLMMGYLEQAQAALRKTFGVELQSLEQAKARVWATQGKLELIATLIEKAEAAEPEVINAERNVQSSD